MIPCKVGAFGGLTGGGSLKIDLDEMHVVLALWLELQLEDDRP